MFRIIAGLTRQLLPLRFPIAKISTKTQEKSIRDTFDSQKFVEMLQKEGFNKNEAQGLISLISEVIDESLDSNTKSLVTKQEQEDFFKDCHEQLEKMKRDIDTIANQDFGYLKTRTDAIKSGVDASKNHVKEGISKIQSGTRLDMNLEKSRIQVEMQELKTLLEGAEVKIDQQLEKLETRLEKIKRDTRAGVSRIIC